MLSRKMQMAVPQGGGLTPFHQWDLSTLSSSGGVTTITDLQGRNNLAVADADAPTLANTDEITFSGSQVLGLSGGLNTGAEVVSIYANVKASYGGTAICFELSDKWNSNTGATFIAALNASAVLGQIGVGIRGDGSTTSLFVGTGGNYFDNGVTFKKMLFEFHYTNDDIAIENGSPYLAMYDSSGLAMRDGVAAADGAQQTTYPLYIGARAGSSLFAYMTLKGEMNLYTTELTEDERTALLA